MAIKKKKNSFDVLVFLFIIAIALGSYSSYSKYTSSVSGNSSVDIAAWSVVVNTDDINNVTALTENISFTPIGSQYVAAGKMAPSVGGYFDISIDTTNAEVASTYTINMNLENVAGLGGFEVIGYEVLTDEEIDADNDGEPDEVEAIPDSLSDEFSTNGNISTISRNILLTDAGIGSKENVRVYLEWDGNEGINPNSTTVQIPVGITVEQYFE